MVFQSRFASVPLEGEHVLNAVRYVCLNPVRAGLVARAVDWPWSSVRAHLTRQDGQLTTVSPILDLVDRFEDLLETEANDAAFWDLRRAERSGRPLGSKAFIERLLRRRDAGREGT